MLCPTWLCRAWRNLGWGVAFVTRLLPTAASSGMDLAGCRGLEGRLLGPVTVRPCPAWGLAAAKALFQLSRPQEEKLKRWGHRPCLLLEHGPQSVPSNVQELRECPRSGTLESLLSTRSHAQPCLSFSSFVPYHTALFDREENEGAEKLNSLHKATQLAVAEWALEQAHSSLQDLP